MSKDRITAGSATSKKWARGFDADTLEKNARIESGTSRQTRDFWVKTALVNSVWFISGQVNFETWDQQSQNRPPLDLARHAALVSKGTTLLDHCLSQQSTVCVLGFASYEFGRNAAHGSAIVELLGIIAERRAAVDSPEEIMVLQEMIDVLVGELCGKSQDETRNLLQNGHWT